METRNKLIKNMQDEYRKNEAEWRNLLGMHFQQQHNHSFRIVDCVSRVRVGNVVIVLTN